MEGTGPFSRNQELINQELPRSNIMPTRPAQAGRLQLGSEGDFYFFLGGGAVGFKCWMIWKRFGLRYGQ